MLEYYNFQYTVQSNQCDGLSFLVLPSIWHIQQTLQVIREGNPQFWIFSFDIFYTWLVSILNDLKPNK